MPIYEYQCSACGHTLEAFQSMSEAPLKDCPKCNKTDLQKLVSAAGFQLKGTGWYATDFKNKGKPESTSTKTESTTTTNTETKTDSSSSTNETKTKE
jgi:putative FmdB family regulatory protein